MKQEDGPVRIFVSRAGQSTQLRLRDNRNNPNPQNPSSVNVDTLADAGDQIIWELDPKSLGSDPEPGFFPIGSLVRIEQSLAQPGSNNYPNSVEVLDGNPVKQADGTIVGRVPNPSKKPPHFANYKIVYTLPDGSQHEVDPKIQLNS